MEPGLHQLRVLDITHSYAGPYCTLMMRLQGADVLKIEAPEGDDFRHRPGLFAALNAGKRSRSLDLTTPEGRAALRELARDADVVVTNIRPDRTPELGLTRDFLAADNEGLVFCSITGLGAAVSQAPAIEWTVQAMTGLMRTMLGDDTDPLRQGVALVDHFAGITAYAAIMTALVARASTGRGASIEISMRDVVGAMMSPYVVAAAAGEPLPTSVGVRVLTGDGLLYVPLMRDKWFAALCRAAGVPELLDDPRFATLEARRGHLVELTPLLAAALTDRTAVEWERELQALRIPAAAVRTVHEAIAEQPEILTRFAPISDSPVAARTMSPGFHLPDITIPTPLRVPALAEESWNAPAWREH